MAWSTHDSLIFSESAAVERSCHNIHVDDKNTATMTKKNSNRAHSKNSHEKTAMISGIMEKTKHILNPWYHVLVVNLRNSGSAQSSKVSFLALV